ncbi:MAG: Altronate dehydratase [Thermotoga sp. 50_1627]|uniref:UxaA family hydrolase n=1 Tax=Pseudothermotoga sp. TaxID=2033661 RepID=UPI00076DB46E|nr:MAG: Altronate dehydratase [Thermotoga sp. 50_64]KUK24417.1 MAG: Altronate dehydratase [Thermotoga sp. 50_1627]MBC7116957.1 UxaA family hydrolase [Pseudothermotoga sp.]MDK2923559.1 altronate dehydratase large subunit [Pseudothermotoga sp.]HBT40455.1 carbohydrate hydrolase [Pseudothermotoga sp.]
MKLKGFLRPDGKIGFRNHFLVVPTVICATRTAEEIASNFSNVVCLHNQHGCNHMKEDERKVVNVLKGLACNPNVAGVLFVGLGCETIPTMKIFESVRATGKPAECLIIQEEGGTLRTIEKGVRILQKMMEQCEIKEVEVDLSNVIVAIECGGSDTTSGIASNPVVGYVADKLVDAGAAVVFSETTEIIGAEHLLARRAVNEEVAKKLLELVSRCERSALAGGEDVRGVNPTPGNIRGGLTTLEEKSLGAIYKAGTRPISGVLEYGEPVPARGLYFMDSPGHDVESVSGMVAGGAQVVIFTTGRGTPTGCPIAPVIKVTANAKTYSRMSDNIDVDVSDVLEGKTTIQQAGERLYQKLIEVLNGKLTKSEMLRHREFGIYLTQPTL